MSEQEPVLPLALTNGEEFLARRDNSVLFRFFGQLAMYDHVFFIRSTENEEVRGVYLFSVHPVFEEVSDFMLANDYPSHLNIREVAECDKRAFETMVHRDATEDLDAGVPDDWA